MFDSNLRPKVGVGVLVIRDNKILLGDRRNPDGTRHWTVPGGKMEFCESFEQCALREIEEEIGLKIELIDRTPIAVTNDIHVSNHYVTLFLRAKYVSGDPEVKEKQTFNSWKWFSLDNLPEPLSITVSNLIKETKKIIP